MIQVKLWALEKGEKDQVNTIPLEVIDKTETENQLENIIVSNPDILMPGLKLIGRQTPTEGGFLDLLGVNEDGTLIVFELKKGLMARDAVAQIIDYASFLDDLDKETLFKHISDRSGNGGIEKIDFESWYEEQFSGNFDALNDPPKMVLVSLGADARTKRMVNYLSKTGVEISLITFYSFKKDNQVFLARQVEVELHEKETVQKQKYTKNANLESLNKLIDSLNAKEIFEKVTDLIRTELSSAYEWPSKSSKSYSFVEKTDEGRPTYRAYLSVYLHRSHPNSVELAFHTRTVELVKDIFISLKAKYKELITGKWGNENIRLKEGKIFEEFKEDFKIIAAQINSERLAKKENPEG
jgi:hypothetical protein